MFAFDSADQHFSAPADADGAVKTPKSSRQRSPSRDESWISPGFAGGSPVNTKPALHLTRGDSRSPRPDNPAQQVDAPIAPTTTSNFAQTPLTPKAGGKAGRKKKRAMKMAAKMGAPALNTVRGFTPVTSGDDDSDHSNTSNPKLASRFNGIDSEINSPDLRPMTSYSQSGGLSALALQLDTLNLENESKRSSKAASDAKQSSKSSTSSSRANSTPRTMSDHDPAEMTSYEIPLEHDFVSADIGERAATPDRTSLARKMSADDFEPLSCLGKGTYGTVILVKQKETGRLYAQKQFRKASLTVHKKLVEQTKTERVILESVNRHPFVVKLYYAFQDHEKLYLILEYAEGGELFTHLAMERMFTEEVACFYMAEMVLALEHLHHNVGVVYRDLKPENCLLDSEGHLLLTDFGLSKVAVESDDDQNNNNHCKSILGTIEYMAPEVIQGLPYGTAVDWWSFGALGFDLLTGAPPFTANNHAKMQEKIVKQKLALPYFLGPDAKDLLTRLLRKEPTKRLGANMPKDLQTIKNHRFFKRIDWKALGRRELEPPIRPIITDPELAENFSREFTDLAVSPVVARSGIDMAAEALEGRGGRGVSGGNASGGMAIAGAEGDLFGGFSFVASRSLLDCGDRGY
ncbi:MAG: hypothetical protein M1819_004547 [Sarea resinae]|nr:MAG: hypothetical protein M1819_004547 [Sarea resinae]